MSGYLDPRYAVSLGHLGSPVALPGSGGVVLERPIERTGRRDATGPYPFLACRDWRALPGDIEGLDRELVSLVAVADPLRQPGPDTLRRAFPDLVAPYKTHYLVDLAAPERALPAGHARNLRKARETVAVEQVDDPPAMAEQWAGLYAGLGARHAISGPADFPREALDCQLAVPGLTLLRAVIGGETAGLALFYGHFDDVCYHLGAYAEAGYAAGASFALFDHAIRHFRAEGRHRLLLGSGAGVADRAGSDGLSRFKRGWATGSVQGWLCGRILDARAYAELGGPGGGHFPAYRAPRTEPKRAVSR